MDDSDVVIRVEGLGKKYALHHEKSERYTALRDVVARKAKAAGELLNPFTLAGQLRKAQRQAAVGRAESEEEFWALKDVSFEIRRGERVGIIGRNGAGKSTLLKILSRITEPSTGRVEIRGRVASLLEVGTGFHPELTGRENIYLNGAILGMTRREIRSKFDEIVDFAEVEKFLDTPVKRYSSGMYVRLAFAVAANLEPEILVVDEVLAVGDSLFQKKCIDKMRSISRRQARTILLVSHQLESLRALSERAISLQNGAIIMDGSSSEVISQYIESTMQVEPSSSRETLTSDLLDILEPSMQSSSGAISYSDHPLLSMKINLKQKSALSARVIVSVQNDEQVRIFSVAYSFSSLALGLYSLGLEMPSKILRDGLYTVLVSSGLPGQMNIFPLTPVCQFRIFGCTSGSFFPDQSWPGVVLPHCKWILHDERQES